MYVCVFLTVSSSRLQEIIVLLFFLGDHHRRRSLMCKIIFPELHYFSSSFCFFSFDNFRYVFTGVVISFHFFSVSARYFPLFDALTFSSNSFHHFLLGLLIVLNNFLHFLDTSHYIFEQFLSKSTF